MDIKMRKEMLVVSVLTVLLLFIAAIVSVTGAEVRRSVSTNTPAPGAEFDVMLTISGLQSDDSVVCGIVETIPEGFEYVKSEYPSDQISVSGQRIAFAVINVTTIRYTVKSPSSGSGMIKGEWINLLNETDGKITDTGITVITHGSNKRDVESTQTPTMTSAIESSMPVTPTAETANSTSSPTIPGFEVVFASVALLLHFIFSRRGDKK